MVMCTSHYHTLTCTISQYHTLITLPCTMHNTLLYMDNVDKCTILRKGRLCMYDAMPVHSCLARARFRPQYPSLTTRVKVKSRIRCAYTAIRPANYASIIFQALEKR